MVQLFHITKLVDPCSNQGKSAKNKTMTNIKPIISNVERIKCMCGHNDLICNHCEHPFEALSHCQISNEVIIYCPKCGCPHNGKSADKAEVARKRAELGLIK